MTLAIHHALRTSERATEFIGTFQTAPRLRDSSTVNVRSLASKLDFLDWFQKTLGRSGETHYNLGQDLVKDHPTSV